MLARGAFACASIAITLVACGDNKRGMQPLVADPAVVSGCVPTMVDGTTRAKVVACDEELIGGRLAGGRVGDFVIENSQLRAIVRGKGEGLYQHGSYGGGLVDVATVGGEDLVKEIQPSVDLAVGAYDKLVITEAGDDGAAEIVVRGPATSLEVITAALDREVPPVIIEHRYRLAPDAREIEMETRVYPTDGAAAADVTLFEAVFLGGRAQAFLPRKGVASGQGAAEMIATSGTTTSYGFVYPPDQTNPQLIDLGGIRLIQGPSIPVDGLKRWLVVGDGSVASVTDRGWQLRDVPLGEVTGTTEPGAQVAIESGDVVMTIARGGVDGTYRASVPPGTYTVRANALGHAPGTPMPVSIAEASVATQDVVPGPSGRLAISVADGAATPLPARVLIEQQGQDRRIEYVGAAGTLMLPMPPGTWRVSVSRGLEYEAFVASAVAITATQTTQLDVVLDRVVDTSGWIALDTHLHSELSTDSTIPVDDRVRAVAAEGVEVPVSTDHDFITEYGPIIEELGLASWLRSLDGEEVSSIVWGHTNAFPLVADPSKTARGAAHWADQSPAQVYAVLRNTEGAVVQVNHPRRTGSDLFDAIELDPATLTANRSPTALGLPADTDLSVLDFDLVEVANGKEPDTFDQVFEDWLAMVTAGHPAGATGSTDSHGASDYAGETRTYVYVGTGNDTPATVNLAAVVDGLRARNVVVATGAFVTAGIVGASGASIPGDTANVQSGQPIKLRIKVQAPPWQALSSIRIFEKRQPVMAIPLDGNDTAPVRYDADVTLGTASADTFFVVRVELAGRGDPVIDTPIASFTNPAFVHVVP